MDTKADICKLIGVDAIMLKQKALAFARNKNSNLTPEIKSRVIRILNKPGQHDANEALRKIFCQGGGRHTRRAKRSSRRTRHAKRQ